MHKHLKAPLIPPDHVNPKLSAGISEVIEMMMAKDPRKRYKNCKDLLIDLKAVKSGQPPVIARHEVKGEELANMAQVEAQMAAGQIAMDPRSAEAEQLSNLRLKILVVILICVALASILLNVVQALG